MDGGKLQLSIYTEASGKFPEVVVDHRTGKVAGTEAIIGGDDLARAKAQAAALPAGKASSRYAVGRAVKAHAPYRAVSVYPSLTRGRPVAEERLAKATNGRPCRRIRTDGGEP